MGVRIFGEFDVAPTTSGAASEARISRAQRESARAKRELKRHKQGFPEAVVGRLSISRAERRVRALEAKILRARRRARESLKQSEHKSSVNNACLRQSHHILASVESSDASNSDRRKEIVP